MEPVHTPPATTSTTRKPSLLILVDGTNFQASMREAGLEYPIDFPRLAHQLAKSVDGGAILVKLRFYAAASANREVRKREAVLFDVLRRSSATELVEGWHERKQCSQCRAPYHREKATDVNLAVDLVDGAHRDKYDVVMVISADSDFVPAMERVRTVTKIRDGVPAQEEGGVGALSPSGSRKAHRAGKWRNLPSDGQASAHVQAPQPESPRQVARFSSRVAQAGTSGAARDHLSRPSSFRRRWTR